MEYICSVFSGIGDQDAENATCRFAHWASSPPSAKNPKTCMLSRFARIDSANPGDAWRREVIATPEIKPDEVLIYVMASGVNYNNVWAALGTPLDVIADRLRKGEPEDFHAGGSDCAGIVWRVGEAVTSVKPGDEVVIHSGWWEPDDPWVQSGSDPMLADSVRIWGYQTNHGSYCQFARAQAHQCMTKPKQLSWAAAASYLLCASTAYRMLMGWPPNIVEADDLVLVWGAAGGLGSMALQITRAAGGRAIAVVSSEDKRQFCLDHGAIGVINRNDFDHWGVMPDVDSQEYGAWAKGARAFGKAIWEIAGAKIGPKSSSSIPARRPCRPPSWSATKAA